jgi:hypothetical protein
MTHDLTKLLKDWPFVNGQLAVRLIEGDDGNEKLQIRLDLGLLQLEAQGRPDGSRPNGFESLLDYYESKLEEHTYEGGDPEQFQLDEDACRALREEASQYYHRYVALYVLEDLEGVLRDTSRNLRALEFMERHARSEEDRETLSQFRPYLLMMRARALAGLAIRDREPRAAILAIDEALDRIKNHFEEAGEPELFEDSSEARLLEGMKESLVPKLPVSPESELRDRLNKAIEHENYELAAILRDELRAMGSKPGA